MTGYNNEVVQTCDERRGNMGTRDKYLLGVAVGIIAFGLALVAAKAAPKMKARMAGHCREMMSSFVEATNSEEEREPIPR
jgi:hypothetical protein